MGNLVNAERVSIAFGTRVLLDEVSLGLSSGEVIGVVGRNGDGKTTLLDILTGRRPPDSGQVIHANTLHLGYLSQREDFAPGAAIRDVVVGGQPDHVWAADSERRQIVQRFLGSLDLDASVSQLSGGERRRVSLTGLLLGGHDLLVLDEPTNHLDVEAISWLAEHLQSLAARGTAMLVVSHDRWFLDAICNQIWEVHDAKVDSYEGGYAAYVLARAERARIASVVESRRQNLLRKELAWLRRGPPARTSKPKFRIDAANALIADVPDPRDKLGLREFAMAHLGKDVFDLHQATYVLDDSRVLLKDVNWSIGPGDRIGIIGVNGAGKTTLLDLLAHRVRPTSGKVKQGKTIQLGYLSQAVEELDDTDRVRESVERLKHSTRLATGHEASASSLLEGFGFSGQKLMTRIGDLSGGERRRLQLLRLLLAEPNVLLLDEPTNDLDIDTLTVIEDYLDTWPGTLIAVSHDRYFLERVCDVVYALLGDGRCVLLPGGVDEYLALRARPSAPEPAPKAAKTPGVDAQTRQAKKDLARIEGQLEKLQVRVGKLHAKLAEHSSDYTKLVELSAELDAANTRIAELEAAWLEAAETLN
ncbi:MAG: ABC-F family ATP-binding cassette domain-containing protein [Propionibacteriaceae bacterium]|jgi:ATPase subunit of ABC transporter with duplicated ATPase domains|nr:ABC-F family ATP-binding cassette domain-containing protein [Propionibacteriaceae bacterium]